MVVFEDFLYRSFRGVVELGFGGLEEGSRVVM